MKATPISHASGQAADLVSRTEDFIRREKLFLPGQPLLLAVSGGVDSVVLCELMHRLGYTFSIAHVNFHLRGDESDRDEHLVRELGLRYQTNVHVHHADTLAYATAHGQSIQEAARAIRYDWFHQLRVDLAQTSAAGPVLSPTLCTAHHLDDNMETVLLNFMRGTGISGLRGMLPHTDRVARPLLFATRAEIEAFARQSGLSWVEDSSNFDLKYRRNYIRHALIPVIEKQFPHWSATMQDHIRRFRDIEQFTAAAVQAKLRSWVISRDGEWHIPVNRLKQAEGCETILYYFLKDAGFSPAQVHEALHLLEAESGRQIQSGSHRLLRHRAWLILAPLAVTQPQMTYVASLPSVVETGIGILEISLVNGLPSDASLTETGNFYLDARDITLPLLARPWKKGDYFYPLGMRKKKKLARVFIDAKMSATEKENQWVLISQDRIILVPGFRIDDRFRITPSTKQVLSVRVRVGDLQG
jgi:tRNA(Ile)-lysidine synthase